MGLFGRKKSVDDQPDPYLDLLTIRDADRLRALTRAVLAENGFEAQVFGDHLALVDGRTLGLDNLARKVHVAEGEEWDRIVRAHLAALLRPSEDPTGDDLLTRIVARLLDVSVGSGDPRLTFDYALPWQPGVAEILVVDHPDHVSMLGDGSVREMAPLGPWYDRARRNLFRELTETAEVRVETVEHDGHRFQCALSESVFTASGALLLPELLPRWVPGIDVSGGVLFAAPFRNQLAFAACSSAEAALGGLMLLPVFAANGYSDGVGPVSPNVYYWRDGTVTQISTIADDALNVTPPPELLEIINGG
ncbi:hypothetical protein [Tsukamurella ocularis]|uniref:hypothetical protein n=1 Tax=Tsukamurella ocularis TaxID=1970234 RepID=UPI002169766F|nr:hypothetical protein [Tsukamurella ocularis]MCS3782270.1 hypothetical protein [Tsukamurella ocularis]MCS3789570.1 hypothetical protein [Tsukamurella ocularis]MCS3852717.1 hypothetical protein [Tsukamurella ocularis]